MSQIQFDATKVAPQSDRAAVPEGEYNVILHSSEVKGEAKNKRIATSYKILTGDLAGQFVHANLTFLHENSEAQRIGQEQLSALCHAVGVLQISDTSQLHGRPLRIRVSVREVEKEKDGAKTVNKYNDINAWIKADGNAAGAVPAAAAPPAWAAEPAPAPVAPTPAPAPAPAPAPVADNRMFYVAHKGANVTPQPLNADGVRALGLPIGEIQLCVAGESQWQPGTILEVAPAPVAAPTPAPAPAAAGALPPWMQK